MANRAQQSDYDYRQGQRSQFDDDEQRFDQESGYRGGRRYEEGGRRDDYGSSRSRWDQESGYRSDRPRQYEWEPGRSGGGREWREQVGTFSRDYDDTERYGGMGRAGMERERRYEPWRMRGSQYGGGGGSGSQYGGYGSGYGQDYGRDYGQRRYGEGSWSQQGGQIGQPGWEQRSRQGTSSEQGRWSQAGWEGYGRENDFYRSQPVMQGRFTGRGPKGYTRKDDSICDEVCDILTRHGEVDASEIQVSVMNAEVTLSGNVDDRRQRHLAEESIENISGVKNINNQLRVGNKPAYEAERREREEETQHAR